MGVRVRAEYEPPEDTTIVIHGGVENIERFVNRALEDYEEYRPLRDDGYGHFALSVYAAVGAVTAERIKDALPHGAVGETTVGALRQHFRLLPTVIFDDETDDPINAIQDAHFDVVLLEILDPRLLRPNCLAGDEPELEVTVRQLLTGPVEVFCELFRPRRDKRTGTIRDGGTP